MVIERVMVVPVRKPSFEEVVTTLRYCNPMSYGTKNMDYVAFYRTKPISAITHYGKVEKIERKINPTKYYKNIPDWVKGYNKIKCYHLEWLKKLDDPIRKKITQRPIYGPIYITLSKLVNATTLSDVYNK